MVRCAVNERRVTKPIACDYQNKISKISTNLICLINDNKILFLLSTSLIKVLIQFLESSNIRHLFRVFVL